MSRRVLADAELPIGVLDTALGSGHSAPPMATPAEVFLRGVWKAIIPRTDDVSWVARVASSPASNKPLGDYGPLVARMLASGISAEEIARFAQIVGYEAAFGLCYYLGDSERAYEGETAESGDEIQWCLFRVDPDSEEPLEPITMLHESLLSADPSGREMRP